MLFRGDVARNGDRLATGVFHPFDCVARVLLLIEIGDDEVGAFTCESDCNGLADAGIRAGDQSDLAAEKAAALVRLLAVIRLWLHLTGGAWWRLLLFRIGRGRAANIGIHVCAPQLLRSPNTV